MFRKTFSRYSLYTTVIHTTYIHNICRLYESLLCVLWCFMLFMVFNDDDSYILYESSSIKDKTIRFHKMFYKMYMWKSLQFAHVKAAMSHRLTKMCPTLLVCESIKKRAKEIMCGLMKRVVWRSPVAVRSTAGKAQATAMQIITR